MVFEQITEAEARVKEAAERGASAAELRGLRARVKALRWQADNEAKSARAHLEQSRRNVQPPGKNEEREINEQVRELSGKLNRLESGRANKLALLSTQPENETVLTVIEKLENEIAVVARLLSAHNARLIQIRTWHDEQEQKRRLAAEHAQRKKAEAERRKD